MMLYLYVKDASGNVVRVGAECSIPAELRAETSFYSEKGYVAAEAYEHDAQILAAAKRAENTEGVTSAEWTQEAEEEAKKSQKEVQESARSSEEGTKSESEA